MSAIATTTRDAWLLADDAHLLAQCREHRYRASGPGGQHRNKTESAIRLVHQPTGITVTATERRSQHENRANALQRLREAIAIGVRCPLDMTAIRQPDVLGNAISGGRVVMGRRDPRHLVLLAWLLDAVKAAQGRISDVARIFGLTTSQLVSLLKQEPKRLATANAIRARAGLESLR
jgi:hypothetical protein